MDVQQRYEAFERMDPYAETVVDFREYVGKLRELFPEWRPGQTWFNALNRSRPQLADRVRATGLDPFYDDKKLPALHSWLALHWND